MTTEPCGSHRASGANKIFYIKPLQITGGAFLYTGTWGKINYYQIEEIFYEKTHGGWKLEDE